jgi:hypothetical protein
MEVQPPPVHAIIREISNNPFAQRLLDRMWEIIQEEEEEERRREEREERGGRNQSQSPRPRQLQGRDQPQRRGRSLSHPRQGRGRSGSPGGRSASVLTKEALVEEIRRIGALLTQGASTSTKWAREQA